jgi:hypothetical protein
MVPDERFKTLLDWQLTNHGRSGSGIKYKTLGSRMSGDMNTALGNCILSVIMAGAFFMVMKRAHGIRQWDIFADGDDVLLIVEQRDVARVMVWLPVVYREFGMVMKVDQPVYRLEEVSFCQGHPVEYAPGKYKFVRNPWKVLSTALSGSKYFDASLKARARLVHTIGCAELVLNLGIPVLQEYALALIRVSGTDALLELSECDALYFRLHRELRALGMTMLERHAPQVINSTARLSFFYAFGITEANQLEIERSLSEWTFELDVGVEVPPLHPMWSPQGCSPALYPF